MRACDLFGIGIESIGAHSDALARYGQWPTLSNALKFLRYGYAISPRRSENGVVTIGR
jgi:hypothetical protein